MIISPDGKTIIIRLPDNWHFHFRQGAFLAFLVAICLRYGWRARIVGEPNTTPPKITGKLAFDYKEEIEAEARKHPHGDGLEVIPALQITEHTTREMVRDFHERGGRIAKIYPLNVTTNSENGVYDYTKTYPALAECEKLGIIVQFHAQHPSYEIEGWYKEIRFLELILEEIEIMFPGLKMTVEHIHSALGVQWVKAQTSMLIVAGVSIQHLTNTIDDVIGYSEQSHGKYCVHNAYKPHAGLIADRTAIQDVVLDGDPRFFYAGDDAWHLKKNKECAEAACGAANTLAALAKLTSFFIKRRRIELLEPFTSEFGARFYGYPLRQQFLTLVRNDWTIDMELPVPGTGDVAVPWCAGHKEEWQVVA